MLPAGRQAPDFELTSTSGETESLGAILRERPAVLVFFKINCPTCQLTMPFVQRMANDASPESPRLLPISQNNLKDTADFLQHFGLRLPVLLDRAEEGYPVSNNFRIDHVPTFFSIQPDGSIAHSFTGFVKSEMEELGLRFGVQTFRPDEQVPFAKPG